MAGDARARARQTFPPEKKPGRWARATEAGHSPKGEEKGMAEG